MLSLHSQNKSEDQIDSGSKLRRISHLDHNQFQRFSPLINTESTPVMKKEIRKAVKSIQNFNDKKQINAAIMNLSTIENRKSILNYIIKNKKKQNHLDELQMMAKLQGTLSKIKTRFLQLIPTRDTHCDAVMDQDYFLKFSLTQKNKEPPKKDMLSLFQSLGKEFTPSAPVSTHISVLMQSTSQKLLQISAGIQECLDESDQNNGEDEHTKEVNLRRSVIVKPYIILKRDDSLQALLSRAKSRMQTGVYSPRKVVKSPIVMKHSHQIMLKRTLQYLTSPKVENEIKIKNPSRGSFQFLPKENRNMKIKESYKQINEFKSIIERFHEKKEMNNTFDTILLQTQEQSKQKTSRTSSYWFAENVKRHQSQELCTRNYRHLQELREKEIKQRTLLFCSSRIFVNKNNYTIKDNPKSKMRKHKELSKFHSNNQQENDQSFISYTETKLDGIYSNTIQLQKDIMKLDKINLQGGKNETEVQDQINQKTYLLKHNNEESMRLLYRKQSQ